MTDLANPFLAPVDAPEVVEEGELEPDSLWDDLEILGPSVPPPVPPGQATGPGWEVVDVLGDPPVCVMGLHGGAGASTVAALLGQGALDVQTCWPVAAGWANPAPVLNVVAVARTHHRGITAAHQLAQWWAAGQLPRSRLVGLVLVDDGPSLTRAQRHSARRLAGMTPHGWHLPWNEAWRVGEPDQSSTSLRTRRLLKSIHRACAHTEKEHS